MPRQSEPLRRRVAGAKRMSPATQFENEIRTRGLIIVYACSSSAVRDLEVHDALGGELFGGQAAQLMALMIGEHPLVPVRVVHHIDLLPLMDLAHVMAAVIQRHLSFGVHPSSRRVPC